MKLIRKLLKAPALMAAVVFAVGGGGFVVATLILADVLPEAQFGEAVLVIALSNVAIAAGPAAINGIALRHDRQCDRRLVFVGCACVVVASILAAAAGLVWYGMSLVSGLVLAFASVAGGVTLLTRSAFQRALELQRMMILYQIPNIALLAGTVLMLGGVGLTPWFPTLIVGVCHLAVGAYAWGWVWKHQRPGGSIDGKLWGDGTAMGSLALSSETMMQLERLVVPLVLGAAELAQFAVVAAVALTPYRMLEMGTVATLVARLRRADTPVQRARMFRKEVQMLLALCLAGGVLVVLFTPYVCQWVLPESRVSTALAIAVVLSGSVRVVSALTHSSAMAFCEGRELQVVNVANWLAVVIGALTGIALSRFGLVGLVCGVAVGWLFRAGLSGYVGARHFRAEGRSAQVA